MKAWLPEALAKDGTAVRLDLAEVSEVDTAGLQLLLALQRSAQDAGAHLALQSASPAVMDVLRLTDLEHLMAPGTGPAA